MTRLNLSLKLFFLFSLMIFAVLLIPDFAQGDRSCSYTPGTDGGNFCKTRTGNFAGIILEEHAVCLPWQTAKIRKTCIIPTAGGGCREYNCNFDGCIIHPSYIKAPKNPRYYDNPNYPTNPFAPEGSMAPDNITLPVKLDWDDVEGWKNGWIDDEAKDRYKKCSGPPAQCIGQSLTTCLSKTVPRYDGDPNPVIVKGPCEKKCEAIGKEFYCLSTTCGNWYTNCDRETSEQEKKICSMRQDPPNSPCNSEGWRNTCKLSCPNKCAASINFYQIKITGGMKDLGAMEEIDELEEKMESETDPKKVEEYLEEIERIKKEDLEISEYKAFSDKSEFITPSCILKSGRDYTWQVRGCGAQDEATCGLWSNAWSFSTSRAPEPYYPLDPDWGGPELIENLNKEESKKLNWCKVEDEDFYEETMIEGEKVYRPLSYKLLLYYSENDSCFNRECFPEILAPDRNVYSREKLPPDELTNEGLFFTKKTVYAWKVAACKYDSGQECSDYSQLWRFSTGDWGLEVTLINPPNDAETPIGLPVTLTWSSAGANSYNYELKGVDSGKNKTANIPFDSPKILPNTVYEWTVQACSDHESNECEDTWAGPWQFKTTGQPPNLIYPVENNTPIPISFEWQRIPGAKSYVFKIQGEGLDKKIITGEDKQSVSLNYPDLKQEINYTWQVKTCAKTEGNVCGSWSNPQQFKTFKVKVPEISYPKDNESFFTYQKNYIIDWEKAEGANFYEYEVNLTKVSPEETNKACGSENIIPQTITRETNSVSLELVCLGDYQWKIRSCLDENCQETSDWSSQYNFSFVQKEKPTNTGGLVPCGKTEDNPDTTWNEREDCEIKHTFLLIRNVIDFVLWTIAPILLALLVMGTAVMFYFSVRFQDSLFLTRIKLIWKAAGMGYGVIFLAWIILNLFLSLIGFQIGIFGNWWQVGF